MSARYLNILEKHRGHPGMIASISDFTVTDGEAVAASVVLAPNISLYCFDDTAKEAIFVELPEGVDLSQAPFVYYMQYEQAKRLIAVPYAEFRQVAHTLPPVEHLIMVYIGGRSGSTLISNIFNELDDVVSLSEPDVGTQFLHLRHAGAMSDADLRDLLDCTLRMLFKPTPFKTPSIYALKLRSEALRVMDLYQAAFPQAKNLFSYRDAVGFVASFYRVFKRDDGVDNGEPIDEFFPDFSAMLLQDATPMRAYLAPDATSVDLVEYMTLWWLAIMEWYLGQHTQGIPALPVSYADLNTKREATLKAIFEYCGLPTEQIPQALHAYERDSQAGTFLAREKPSEGNKFQFNETQLESIRAVLARHPVIKVSDFVAPGTPVLPN
jgi:hypothetical protein